MKYKMMPVVEANEIEKAVELQYGVNIELAPLMWPEDFQNDCYKSLCFDDDMVADCEEDEYDNEQSRREHLMIYSILRDIFPENIRTILVDVSW